VNGNTKKAPTSKEVEDLLMCLKVKEGESWKGRAGRLMCLHNKNGVDIGRNAILRYINGKDVMPRPTFMGFESIIKEEIV